MSIDLENNTYKNIQKISDSELIQLWEIYLKDKSNKKVRDQLILQYIYLTRYVIGRIRVNLPHTFAIEDIVSYGVEGLIDAIEKFSPIRGARFESYAITRIRGNIIDKIRAQDWLPRQQRKKLKEINQVIEKFRQEQGRLPSSAEIAKEMDVEVEKIDAIMADNQSISSMYDKRGSSEESLEVIDTIEDSKIEDPLEMMADKDAKKDLQIALRRLPERERMIMVLYYHENLTLKEIGETLELSESRVCQLHSQAIMKLRNILTTTKSDRLKRSIIS